MIPKEKLVVGIVTYNSAAVICDCIKSLCDKVSLYIIDNNSFDGTTERAIKCCSALDIIRQNKNIGFGRSVNSLLRSCDSEYVLILNPDARVTIDDIKLLIEVADRHEKALIVGPLLRFSDGRLQRSFMPFNKLLAESRKPIKVKHMIGAVMLLKRERILSMGGFDENLFLYGEDVDLCIRVNNAGHDILLVPQACAEHFYGSSTVGVENLSAIKSWHLSWARVYVLLKHHGKLSALMYLLKVTAIYSGGYFFAILTRNSAKRSECSGRVQGAYAAFLGRSSFNGRGQ